MSNQERYVDSSNITAQFYLEVFGSPPDAIPPKQEEPKEEPPKNG